MLGSIQAHLEELKHYVEILLLVAVWSFSKPACGKDIANVLLLPSLHHDCVISFYLAHISFDDAMVRLNNIFGSNGGSSLTNTTHALINYKFIPASKVKCKYYE